LVEESGVFCSSDFHPKNILADVVRGARFNANYSLHMPNKNKLV